MFRLLTVMTCAVVFPAVTAAGPAKPKAHVECMSGEPIKSGKPAKLTAELWCAIRIDKLGGFKPDGLVGGLSIQPGAATTLKVRPGGVEAKIVDTQDGVEARLENPWVVDKDYKVCEPFKVIASLHDEANRGMDDEVWTQTFTIAASCPKPKPVKGAIKCNYTAQDGTIFYWPGNGAKVKPRMEAGLSCTLNGGKTENGVKYDVSLAIEKKGKPVTGAFSFDESRSAFFSAEFDSETYESCSNFNVVGEVTANGAKLWSGKLAIKQDCPD